jgi:hypothetical protein
MVSWSCTPQQSTRSVPTGRSCLSESTRVLRGGFPGGKDGGRQQWGRDPWRPGLADHQPLVRGPSRPVLTAEAASVASVVREGGGALHTAKHGNTNRCCALLKHTRWKFSQSVSGSRHRTSRSASGTRTVVVLVALFAPASTVSGFGCALKLGSPAVDPTCDVGRIGSTAALRARRTRWYSTASAAR